MRSGPRWEVELHPYQDEAIRFLHEHKRSALWIDMGLGKTVSTLTVIRDLLRDGTAKRVLVIAPLKVATQTWPREMKEWHHLQHIKYTVIYSKDRAVRTQLAQSPDRLHIINREMLPWLVDMWVEMKKWPYDVIVVDESSSFKDHTTNRFKALKKVRKVVDRMHHLTATPAAESYLGLFAQFYLLDGGERFGDSVTRFRETYFDFNPWSKKYTLKEEKRDEMMEKVASITLVMRAEDYLDLEQPNMLERWVELEPAELRAYKKFERTLILALPGDVEIEALTAAALSQKLLQAASGAVYDETKTPVPFHNHKIESLKELVEELDGSPIMVSYWFKSSLERLKKAFPQATVMDRTGKAVDPWNEGKIPILLVHPQSAGHGLNMQYGPGHDLAFFDMFWSGEMYDQIIRRIARQGQKKVVRVHHILAAETHDVDAMAAQAAKGSEQSTLKDAVKRIRDSIRGRA
jgi:SNF2 family DNA or RNA helicase